MCPACIGAAAWIAAGASTAGVFFSLAIKFPHRARKAARSEQAKAGPPSSGAVSPLQHSKGEKAMQKEIESANPAVERSH